MRHLKRDPTMKNSYTKCLSEYKLLDHFQEIMENNDFKEGYYLPHHGILRSSSRTKLPVVVGASAKATSGNF